MKVSLFDFDLPSELIAQKPVSPRDSARLLHVPAGDAAPFGDRSVGDLPDLLRPGDLMVFNDTRVIPARLSGRKARPDPSDPAVGAKIEATLHRRVGADSWRAFARPARKLGLGDVVEFGPDLRAEVADKLADGEVELRFDRNGDDLMAAICRRGVMPLPPYIKRDAAGDAADRDDYQTMFAARDGAVAAPTAALHFTPRLMAGLADRGVGDVRLTLHVGAGTFLPVKADDTEDHRMHAEWGRVDEAAADAVNRARAEGRRVVACGTTALRLLESAAGDDGRVRPFEAETRLFITPGYRFRAVDLLLTNFHLPKSTLFMLVCAFAGLDCMKAAYEHAKARGYRFYSYGDCCLLERGDLGEAT